MPINSFENYPMSWKPNKCNLKRPFYLSIAEALENDIHNGFLAPGTKLPPQRELADFLDINFTTITRSYKICELKGLIYAVTGKGTFVSPNATKCITISTNSFSGSINLGFVASFECCNSMILDTTKKIMEKHYLEKLLNYDNPTGIPHQKKAALNWMENFGIHTDTEHLAIVSGAQNALAITLFSLFEPGNRIAVDLYTYSNFIELSKIFHLQLVPIKNDENGMLPEELETQCRKNSIHGIFLMPSCSNPTTIIISNSRKLELAKVIKKFNLIVIEDDIHAFLTAGTIEDYKQPIFELLPEQTIYICSTSKAICSGLRIAYIVFAERFKKRILQAIFNINVKTSSLDSEIVTELILSGKANEIVNKKKKLAEAANNIFSKYFPSVPIIGHPLSFYRWLPISNNINQKIEENLLKKGVNVFHSNRFLSASTANDKYLRIALSSTSSLNELEIGLKILSTQI
ncbi:PLP-dependent aminotransferase family protein [Clostridium felsineum]|uniref:aminotransferase-like domain-containing protein n=1 Tax=Clostridium felsineum TaxID=36839 RepID=UPI00098C163F|nr:PLP-dependent aminotransferase family protein [Clostridium felsineum]URZ17792.1 Histidinol-phosphate aminotransferase [Clostridium felsineum DSM 794]